MQGDVTPYNTGTDFYRFPGVVVFSEIYQVTGPVARFARQIASNGEWLILVSRVDPLCLTREELRMFVRWERV